MAENGSTGMRIKRRSDGKVDSVTDRHHRTVQYRYDAYGLLTDVRDVAGHWWFNEYDRAGMLSGMIGGNGKRVLSAYYDILGRVSEIHSGRRFEFDYRGHRTEVQDGSG